MYVMKYFDKLIKLSSIFGRDAYYYKSEISHKMGKNEEGLKNIDKVIELDSNYASAHILKEALIKSIDD